MDKTKKTQRSYSSFRAKTQQAEIVDQNDNSWINSQNGQKILKHLNHKISTSQLVAANPNQGLFQSVSQRIPQPKNTAHYNSCMDVHLQNFSECGYDRKSLSSQQGTDVAKLQKVIAHLRQKCKNYEKALEFFNRQRQQTLKYSTNNKQNIKHSNNFNYSEQYYIKEIEDLRHQVLVKDTQLEKCRQLLTTKSTQVEGISKEISQRMEKENDQKTLYIKQLNIKNIEIKKLSERLELFTSELKTKEFVIKEKQQKIQDLVKQLQGFGHKKLKIEGYEQKIHQNQQRLKEIQQYTLRLKEQIDKKDNMNREKSEQVNKMQKSFEEYEQKLKMIEISYVEELEKKNKLQQAFEEMKEQYEKTKQECIKMASLKQLVKQKELQNKNLLINIEQIKKELAQLTEQNEALKQQLDLKGKFESKMQIYENELNGLKKLLRQKDQTICSNTLSHNQLTQLQQTNLTLQQQLTQTQQTLQQTITKLSYLQTQSLNHQSQIQQLTHQNQSLQQQLQKSRQKQHKIDEFYKQNQKLNANIHERLNQIEKLQQRIATLETKLTNLAHENSKIKLVKDQVVQEMVKLQGSLQEGNQQLMRQSAIRQELQQILQQQSQELNKRQHQCTAYRATINQLQEQNVRLCNQLDDMVEKHQQQIEDLAQKLQEFEVEKIRSQEMMEQANKKITLMNETILECKRSLEELGRREMVHVEMVRRMEGEIRKLEEERNKLLEDKGKLKRAIEKIHAVSNDVREV